MAVASASRLPTESRAASKAGTRPRCIDPTMLVIGEAHISACRLGQSAREDAVEIVVKFAHHRRNRPLPVSRSAISNPSA